MADIVTWPFARGSHCIVPTLENVSMSTNSRGFHLYVLVITLASGGPFLLASTDLQSPCSFLNIIANGGKNSFTQDAMNHFPKQQRQSVHSGQHMRSRFFYTC